MKYFMILGISEELIPLIEIARSNGYLVIGTDRNIKSKGLEFVDVPLNIDALNKDLILEVAMKYNIKGVVTRAELLLPTVAYICKKMNLNGLSEDVAEISTNKYLFRHRLNNKGFCDIDYYLLKNVEDMEKILDKLKYPVIVKPVDNSGKYGVSLINSEFELIEHFPTALKNSISKKVIIEEFLDGKEFTIESLTQFGKTHIVAICEKIPAKSSFMDDKLIVPPELTLDEKEVIKSTVKDMISTLKIDNTICHTELKLTKKGPLLIETGARLGGDYIDTILVKKAFGVNMLEKIFKIAIGDQIEIFYSLNRVSGMQMVHVNNFEQIKKNHNIAINDKNFLKYYLRTNKNPGKIINSGDMLGYYIFHASTREELLNSLNFYKVGK